MSNTSLKTTSEWKNLPWMKIQRKIWKLQKRIYRASMRGDRKAVRRLQKTLMRSWSAKCLAVRKVSQDNQGKKTAGIDGVKSLTPIQRLKLASQLRLKDKASPTRRVMIPKPGKAEKRPLGIPTMEDRAIQALVKLALEPQWEAVFEPNSYGFRPGRSAHDAIQAIFAGTSQKPKWVLDADISQCFDRINHHYLLDKLDTFPILRRQIKAWLKSGVMENGAFAKTEMGTPQGGVISPLLANIALHGFETAMNELSTNQQKRPITVIRYADDFVILQNTKEEVEETKAKAEEWLEQAGLELKPSKTHTRHTSEGFNFLGFNARQYSVGEYRATKSSNGKGDTKGFRTLIKPSKEAIQKHLDELGRIIDGHHNAPQEALIARLNPVITGWSNYYSTQVSKEVFAKCDNSLHQKLLAWAKRRCARSNMHETIDNYWRSIGDRNWVFATANGMELLEHAKTPILRHTKVKGNRSPFDGDDIYWGKRMSSYVGLPSRVKKLLQSQKGKCNHCNQAFLDGDLMEVDHIIPKKLKGKDQYNNLQLLHRHCHDIKSATDGSHPSREVPIT